MDTTQFLEHATDLETPDCWSVAIEVLGDTTGEVWVDPGRWPSFDTLEEAVKEAHDDLERGDRLFDEERVAWIFHGRTDTGERLDCSGAEFWVNLSPERDGTTIHGSGPFASGLLMRAEAEFQVHNIEA